MTVAPLKLKIKNFYGELHGFKNNITLMSIESRDKELFKKCRKIQYKITELIGINNALDFVRFNFYHDEFIIVDVHKNACFVKGNYRDKLVVVLPSVIDNYLKTSLIRAKTHKCT